MKVINLGSLNIDHVYQVDHFVQPGETISSRSYTRHCGGKGLNQSIALAQAGATICHAGQIGADGELLRDKLKQYGVDDSLVVTGDTPTGHAMIQVNPQGENCIIVEGGANQAIDDALIGNVSSALDESDWLLLQNETNSIDAVLKAIGNRDVSVAFNPAPMTESVGDLPLNLVDIIFVNEIEGAQLSGKQKPDDIIRELIGRYPDMKIVLTLGSRGAIYADAKTRLEQVAFSVTPIDTTAAGDTFIGFLLASLTAGSTPDTALRLASQAASICVTRHGAADSIPTLKEVNKAAM